MAAFDPAGFRPMKSDEEREAFRRSTRVAFRAGDAEGIDRYIALHDRANLRVLVDDVGGVMGALVRLPMGHFFGGARVGTLGVAAVSVPPEHRGSGSGTALMRACIVEAHAEGFPLATLYASTQALYRKAGFEQAGHMCRYAIPLASIGVRDRGPGVRAGTEADRGAVRACYEEMAPHVHGALDRSEPMWMRVFTHDGKPCEIALVTERVGGAERVTGSLVYRIDPSPGDFRGQSLWVHDMSFTTPAAGRRLLGYLARSGPIAHEAIVQGGPATALLHMLAENAYRCRMVEHWMVRVVDVRRALEARGYPVGVAARFVLDVRDDLIGENNGRFGVVVETGRASVRPVGGGGGEGGPTLSLDIKALAPLYTGFLPASALRLAGVLEGSDGALGAVAAAFAGPAPSMMDMF